MPSFTLDINCLADVDEARPVQGDVLRMIEAARRGDADIAVVASSAFERQPGGGHFDRFSDFRERMRAIGLGDVTPLHNPFSSNAATMVRLCSDKRSR